MSRLGISRIDLTRMECKDERVEKIVESVAGIDLTRMECKACMILPSASLLSVYRFNQNGM